MYYVLRSRKSGKFYTSSTKNLQRRLAEHNSGRSKPTKPYVPFDLVYTESFSNRPKAYQKKCIFKTGKGRELRRPTISHPEPRSDLDRPQPSLAALDTSSP